MSGIHQLILNTLGLTHSLSHAIRFTMHSGSDVKEGLSDAQTLNAVKVNLFGHAYENGETASLGCSRKGRIWSHLVAYDIEDWLGWCRAVGAKLRDDTISDTSLPGNVVVPEPITQRPHAVPFTIEWPTDIFERPEELILFKGRGVSVPFYDVGLALDGHSENAPIGFTVTLGPDQLFRYSISFAQGMKCVPDADDIELQYGRGSFPLSEWLTKRSPIIRFHDNSFAAYGELFRIDTSHRPPFDRDRIEPWDWQGVDLRKESQTASKLSHSIQYRVIKELLAQKSDTPSFSTMMTRTRRRILSRCAMTTSSCTSTCTTASTPTAPTRARESPISTKSAGRPSGAFSGGTMWRGCYVTCGTAMRSASSARTCRGLSAATKPLLPCC